jgi:copper(I)-binding protein
MNKLIVGVGWLLAAVIAAAGCSSAGELQVIDPWARPGIVGGNSAVYFTIDNPNAQADTLLSAAGDIAGKVELHLSKPDEDGVMMMEQQADVPVAGNSAVLFVPGGLHVMLIGLNQELLVGGSFDLQLQFENRGEVTVTVPIEER